MKFRIKQIGYEAYPQVKLQWWSGWRTISKDTLFSEDYKLFDENYENFHFSYEQALEIITNFKIRNGFSKKQLITYTVIK